jgi:multiple sugar transport system substrate-binding protein
LKLTDKGKRVYGFVANGQKGPAVAQDWMQYNRQFGGSILDKDGKPALNSPANIASVIAYKKLFDEAAPPGAADYDWGGREESFRQGLVANMQTWSIGAADYDNPKVSKIAGKAGIVLTPSAQGQPQEYGIGGWALGVNKDIDPKKQEAAWAFIKWVTSPAVHKELNLHGAGSYLRKSEMTDPELLAKYPFLPVIATSFEHGDGDFRPRIPQYPELQDLIGGAINAVLVGQADPKTAMDDIQVKAEALFK